MSFSQGKYSIVFVVTYFVVMFPLLSQETLNRHFPPNKASDPFKQHNMSAQPDTSVTDGKGNNASLSSHPTAPRLTTKPSGPRWVGDNLPSLPASLQHAQDLPPKITPQYVLFFGYDGPEPECCLQQWYSSPFIEKDNKTGKERQFHTSEQYMMYRKALLMSDNSVAEEILAAKTPGEAKALGRKVRNFDQSVWNENCDRVVEEGNFLKFGQDERLKNILLRTGERDIVETSPNDRFWGVGFNSEEALEHVDEWGENRLGKALMRARERLKKV